ncbi:MULTISPECIES: sigma-70 family RNA polymerase sigma factor [Clostridium]|uniref:RNA polymerase sigma factor n=1 Tax=Clostridium senegalense TaxID=1465809 RepID=A0A6M0H7C1_9CLOT|nr:MULTISPECIES: sigma-70 family RNA polymerase sigma factor [Clostridium]NEU05751.1 sigma-70 family RNA polymerase sigma factor [Clostridium senegalense]
MTTVDVLSDINLVNSVLDGNTKDFEIIVDKYGNIVFQFIYSMLKEQHLSEDITQEVFITVYNKLYLYDSKYKFSTWILKIAKNKTIDYIRKNKLIKEQSIDSVKELESVNISPEEFIEYKETREILLDYINNLKDMDRQIIYLKYKYKKTFSEIGKEIDMPESTVKKRFYKARENFKKYKSGKGVERYEL